MGWGLALEAGNSCSPQVLRKGLPGGCAGHTLCSRAVGFQGSARSEQSHSWQPRVPQDLPGLHPESRLQAHALAGPPETGEAS